MRSVWFVIGLVLCFVFGAGPASAPGLTGDGVEGGKVIELWIDQPTAKLDGSPCLIDSGNRLVTPVVYKGRTMLPPRFVAESLNADVCWNAGERSVAVVYGTPVCFIPLCLAAGYPLTLVASQ